MSTRGSIALTRLDSWWLWWSGAAAAPIFIRVLTVASQHPARWTALPRYIRGQAAVESLLLEALAIIVAGPLAGVAVATSAADGRGGAWIVRRCVLLAGLFAIASAAGSWLLDPVASVATLIPSHITLWAAACASVAIGAASTRMFDHPLDAAATALLLALAAGVGLFVGGPVMAEAPAAVVNAALVASPVVAIASAANVDVLRGELLYRFSPIAHGEFQYPAWVTACTLYAVLAVICFAVVVIASHRTRRMISAERIAV